MQLNVVNPSIESDIALLDDDDNDDLEISLNESMIVKDVQTTFPYPGYSAVSASAEDEVPGQQSQTDSQSTYPDQITPPIPSSHSPPSPMNNTKPIHKTRSEPAPYDALQRPEPALHGLELSKCNSLPIPEDTISPDSASSPSSMDDDIRDLPGPNSGRRGHKRTMSLRERFTNSLKLLTGSNRDVKRIPRTRTVSGRLVKPQLDDEDGSCSRSEGYMHDMEEKEDTVAEDPIFRKYRLMDDDALQLEKERLVREYREKAYELWYKYVRVGAEYEINIDFTTRKRFHKLMRNRQAWLDNDEFNERELYILFHGCVQRMFTFLSNSFTRFKDKPDFDRVAEFLII